MGTLARQLTEGLDGETDLIAAFAMPLPAFVIGELLVHQPARTPNSKIIAISKF